MNRAPLASPPFSRPFVALVSKDLRLRGLLLAAAWVAGLAIVLALYRIQKTVYTDDVQLLKW